jgi:nicotinamide-nucleotide amidase
VVDRRRNMHPVDDHGNEHDDRLTDAVARTFKDRGWTLAVAESLTGGLLANRFARSPDASDWFRGGVVAYGPETKRMLLAIGDADVVSEDAASAMACTVAALFDADVAVAVTGVGGPDPEDGLPPGTVWLAVCVHGAVSAQLLELDGEPADVVRTTCDRAVAAIVDAIDKHDEIVHRIAS